MHIEAISFCWNERKILPWAVSSWKSYADHVTVFDNGSGDGSVEYMEEHGIDVIPFGDDHLDNITIRDLKNHAWKEFKDADVVVVADMDEILSGGDIRASFSRMINGGGTLLLPVWYNLIWDHEPVIEEGSLVEQSVEKGWYDRNPKCVAFCPKHIRDMNYCPGAHSCDPEGNIRWWNDGSLFLLHVNNCLSLEYRINRFRKLDARRSFNDREMGMAVHYSFSQERTASDWMAMQDMSIDLKNILNNPEI